MQRGHLSTCSKLFLIIFFITNGIASGQERLNNPDIEVVVNGGVITSRYLRTTRPLPTGILMSNAPTFVSDGITSEYKTLVIGTVVGGLYSRIISTHSRVFYRVPIASRATPHHQTSRNSIQVSSTHQLKWLSTVIPQLQRSILGTSFTKGIQNSQPSPNVEKMKIVQGRNARNIFGSEPNTSASEKQFDLTEPLVKEEDNGYMSEVDSGADLLLSGSEYTTVTYVGFSDYKTTIGSTVVVFMPNSAATPELRPTASATRAGRGLSLTRAPVFVPNSVSETARIVPADAETLSVRPTESSNIAPRASLQSTVTTRVYNTVDFYPTGLVTSIGGAVTLSRVTTVFTTLVYGTFINGRYAKVIKSTSSIYYSTDRRLEPVPTILAKSVGSVTATLRSGLGRAISINGATPQIIVGSAELAKLRQNSLNRDAVRRLDGILQPSTPPLFSSFADREEEQSVLRTYYTTHTYFTTISDQQSTMVSSSLSTESRVATEQLKTKPVTIYTTFTYFSTFFKGDQKTVSTRYITKSQVGHRPILTLDAATSFRYVTKTYFTTYTYLTTSFNGEKSSVQSRLVTTSNIVTSKEIINQHSTVPQVHSSVNKIHDEVQFISTEYDKPGVVSKTRDAVISANPKFTGNDILRDKFEQYTDFNTLWLGPEQTKSNILQVQTFTPQTTPIIKSQSLEYSSTKSLPINSENEIFSSLIKKTISSSRPQFTNRNFLPFRTSGERKTGGLLARLAQSKGFKVGDSGPDDSSKEIVSLSTYEPATKTVVKEKPRLKQETLPNFGKSLEINSKIASNIRSRRPSVATFERVARKNAGLRGLIRVGDGKKKVSFTNIDDIEEEVPIDPTEDPEYTTESTTAATTTTTTTLPPRTLTFERTRSITHGTRNSLPLRRRDSTEKRKGLAGLFSAVVGSSETPEKEIVASSTTVTTIETSTEDITESTTTVQRRVRPLSSLRRSGRQRGSVRERRRRPSRVRPRNNEDQTSKNIENVSESDEKVATVTSRRVKDRPYRPRRRLLLTRNKRSTSDEYNDGDNLTFRFRRQTRDRSRRLRPSQTQRGQQFTLTPQRPRNAPRQAESISFRRSPSNTRRTVPSGRRRRPNTQTVESRPKESNRPAISLRQRLAQAQVSVARKKTSASTERSSGLTSKTPSRTTTKGLRGESQRGKTTRPTFSPSSKDRQRPLLSGKKDKSPTTEPTSPIIEQILNQNILLITNVPIKTTIPLITSGTTIHKEVVTASTVTKTYNRDQLTEIDVSGVTKTHIGISTSTVDNAYFVISTTFIEKVPSTDDDSELGKTEYSPDILPMYTVNPVATTRSIGNLVGNVNPLAALIQQLLVGQTPPNGQGHTFGGHQRTQPQYKTVYSTTTYVTTVRKSEGTTIPVFIRGRLSETVIYDTRSEVITVTEVLTSSTQLPAQSAAPAFGGGLGFNVGYNPQQLLLQQLLQNQLQQQRQFQFPAVQPTPQTAHVNLLQTQPPQLQELLRQATEVTQNQQIQNQPLLQRFQRSLPEVAERSQIHNAESLVAPTFNQPQTHDDRVNCQATQSLESALGKTAATISSRILLGPTISLEKHKATLAMLPETGTNSL